MTVTLTIHEAPEGHVRELPRDHEFFVAGEPKPQGSKRAFMVRGRPVLTESAGQPLRDWRAAVAQATYDQGLRPTLGPVAVIVTFKLARPKSLVKRFWFHIKRPDIDKLMRSVLDAMTGVAYRDDSQVFLVLAHKVYTTEATGAVIRILQWAPE